MIFLRALNYWRPASIVHCTYLYNKDHKNNAAEQTKKWYMNVSVLNFNVFLRRCSWQRDHLYASCCPPVCLFVYLSPKCARKNAIFFRKLSNLALSSLLTVLPGLFKELTLGPLKFKKAGTEMPSWKSLNLYISTKKHPILMKFGRQQHIWNSVTVTRPKYIFLKFKRVISNDLEWHWVT